MATECENTVRENAIPGILAVPSDTVARWQLDYIPRYRSPVRNGEGTADTRTSVEWSRRPDYPLQQWRILLPADGTPARCPLYSSDRLQRSELRALCTTI